MPDALAPDPFTAMAAQLTPKRAVSYIRVSTREQAQRGGSEEGFSLPAQREANKRKAQSMGALVVKEFADRGESARSANRPELQKMLAYLKEDGGIDYVIVHKLDRLARNRADDVEINRAFEEAGTSTSAPETRTEERSAPSRSMRRGHRSSGWRLRSMRPGSGRRRGSPRTCTIGG